MGGGCIEMVREQPTRGLLAGRRLGPYLAERSQVAGRMVVETTHSRIGTEKMVEGAILQHDEDDVFDGIEIGAGRTYRGSALGQAIAAAGSQRRGSRRPRSTGEETTAAERSIARSRFRR